tara:strand:+ start:8243 stop:10903 length:2661 start_codon:yes stop_codon:yes gene_type:complete
MPLSNLKIEALVVQGNSNDNEFLYTSNTQYYIPNSLGNSTYNVNRLPKSYRIRVSVSEEALASGNTEGYYSVSTKNLTISGYSGVEQNHWFYTGASNWTTAPNWQQYYNTSGSTSCHFLNPLLDTDHQPKATKVGGVEGGNGYYLTSNGMGNAWPNQEYKNKHPFPYIPAGGTYSLEEAVSGWTVGGEGSGVYQFGTIYMGSTKEDYKVFDKINTAAFGHQSYENYINTPGNSSSDLTYVSPNDILSASENYYENSQGEAFTTNYFLDSLGTRYVMGNNDAKSQWNDYVDKVVMFNTVGTDDSGNGLPGNEVDVIVVLKDENSSYDFQSEYNFVHANQTTLPNLESYAFMYVPWLDYSVQAGLVKVDIDGDAQWTGHGSVLTSNSRTRSRINGYFTLTVNTEEVHTIESYGGWGYKELVPTNQEINSGLDLSKDRFVFKGSSKVNSSLEVAIIKIEAKDNEYFKRVPTLNSNFSENLFLKVKSKEKTGEKITSYTLCIVYKNNKNITISDDLNVSFNYETTTIPTARTASINNISFGKNIISGSGEKRKITITGTPNTEFTIAVNESFEETITLADGTEVSHFDKINDISILSKAVANSKTTENYGKEISTITSTLGSNGRYSFIQDFPSTIVKKTLVNGSGFSGATTVEFDSTSGLRDGDRFTSVVSGANGIPDNEIVEIAENGVISATRLNVSPAVTLADNAVAIFRRKRCYRVNLIPIESSTAPEYNVPTDQKLYQYLNPVLTLQHSTAGTAFAITHYNGVATGLSAGAEHSIKLLGTASTYGKPSFKQKNVTTKVKVLLTLDIVNSDNFTAVNFPVFRKSGNSSWTNSNQFFNGGTDVSIIKINHSATGANTITIGYTAIVNSWGNENVTMDLDLDKILTIA